MDKGTPHNVWRVSGTELEAYGNHPWANPAPEWASEEANTT